MDDYPAADPIPMPREHYSELMEFLTNSREMRQTARSSMKQAVWAGSGALCGGLLLGPVGGMVGGIAGSIIGFVQADNYDGVLLSVSKLNDEEKKVLLQRVGKILVAAGCAAQTLQNPSAGAFRDVLVQWAAQKSVREDLWNACVQSLQE